MRGKRGFLAIALIVALLHLDCGYILYPERVGRTSGIIDPEVLVMDCLWLLAGIIPGVIAIIVDFHTGCIYTTKKEIQMRRKRREMRLQFRDPAPVKGKLEVTLTGEGKKWVLLSKNFEKGEIIEGLDFTLPEEISSGSYTLTLHVNGKTAGEWILNF